MGMTTGASVAAVVTLPISFIDPLRWTTDLYSAFLAFAAQRVPIGEPLCDLCLEAARTRLVEGLRVHFLRPIVVARKGIGLVMVILVALAVADVLHQTGGGVEDGARRHQRASIVRGPPRRLLRAIGGVRFGRGRAIE